MAFAHLHTHTQYSLLDGSNKIKDYIAKVKEMGMTAAAITDHGVMYGVIDFYREAKAAGINPVLGCEVYVAPRSRFDKEQGHGEDRYYHLILLAENNEGYSNLMKIVSIGFVDGFYYKPRVDFETLEKYHQGLICLSACLAGEVSRNLVRGNYEGAKECALRYKKVFGKGNYFLEMQDHGLADQKTVNAGMMRLHKETGIDLVVTNDCHYTNEEDADAHDILLCLQTGKKLMDEDRMRYEGGQYYVKSEDEMRRIFPYAPEAVENTAKIADRCHVDIEFGVTKLPHYDVPEGFTSETYLEKLCNDGLARRYGNEAKEHKPQLDYELGVIKNMGYVDYFLIVWDFINFARTKGIPVGPGRGSAAGSLVSYCMGITNIDPVRYSLIFERFLNPERVSMPDIDIDFCYERRGEVIDYVVEKYGKDCVSQIVTFGTLKAKGVIRDVGRVLDYPLGFVDAIAKAIPDGAQGASVTIDGALEINKELAERYENEDDVRRLLDTAKRLEGLPRQAGMHAAGVVISQKPTYEYVPLARAREGQIVTQFTMTTIEELGLLKMDFLGLRTLTVINDAVEMIKQNHGLTIDVEAIDYDDKKVYEDISSGHDEGVFQLESAGMQNFMKELSPESLEDVIAGISLYRPGPMDFIPSYIKGKKHPETISYITPELKPILEATYGCIVYQEQVMQIVRDLAGYSLGRSDMVRRAMSKKKMSVMAEERKKFIYGDEADGVPGCIKNGIDEAAANTIFDEMTDFAKYAFNKSHAASYAVVAYQTAYLRYYYPAEFYAALMTSVMGDTVKISMYTSVCRANGIEVMPPDVNSAEGSFLAVDGKVVYGMSAIKNAGDKVIESIVAERNFGGRYNTLEQFLKRTLDKGVNKRTVENLIKAGALDSLEGNRRQKLYALPILADQISSETRKSISGQMSLFDIAGEEVKNEFTFVMPNVEEFSREELLAGEKEVLGIYVSGHPLDEYTELIEKNATAKSSDFMYVEDEQPVLSNRQEVVIGGMLTDLKKHYTRKNEAMMFATLEDLVGSVEVIVFPRVFDQSKEILVEDNKVFIRGNVSLEDEKDSKLLASEIYEFNEAPRELWIAFDTMDEYGKKDGLLKKLLLESEGNDKVTIFIRNPKRIKRLDKRFNVNADEILLSGLRTEFGQENIVLR